MAPTALETVIQILKRKGINTDLASPMDLVIHIERERALNEASEDNKSLEDLHLEALDELYQKPEMSLPDRVLDTLVKTREAAEWFMENAPGTPVPEWVDAAINDVDPDVLVAMRNTGYGNR